MGTSSAETKGSLTIVGTGLVVNGHTTRETLSYLRRSDKLFHLVADPATRAWLSTLNPTAEALEHFYGVGKSRDATYSEIADRILEQVARGLDVCAAFYGHPGVACTPSQLALQRARKAGWPVRILPAVSSLDCLYADLGLDPFEHGCQLFTATDFLLQERVFDPTSTLVLIQLGSIGVETFEKGRLWSREGLRLLTERLLGHYPAEHPLLVYEAALYPGCAPVERRIELSKFPGAEVSHRSTLVVRPLEQREPDRDMLRRLGLLEDFEAAKE